ncbi:MAG TPA: hypothetical protein VFM55_09155 [Micromonosporaceae bacterium]|nr:hypothetical protein [Micromonosporaceae bacterium]
MDRDQYDRICQALDFIGMPMALEVLDDLVHSRSPYSRPADTATITAAVDCLRSVGAVCSTAQPTMVGFGAVELTSHGRDLFWRLVEIEQMATDEAMPQAS